MTNIRRVRPLLGTLVEICAIGDNAPEAVESALAEVESIHRLMSFHEAQSDVSRLNHAPLSVPVTLDRRTHEVLAFAERLSLQSAGLFDVTIGGTLAKAGFLPMPQGGKNPGKASFRDLILLPDNQVQRRREMWIDLGGIAKGYAVDRAVAVLHSHGIRSGTVNAGGDLRMFGDGQPVHIRNPFDGQQLYSLGVMENTAVASSSGYYSRKNVSGACLDPIVMPQETRCLSWLYGITVIAPSCMAADALTKIVRLAPENLAEILAYYGAKALRINQDGLQALSLHASSEDSMAAHIINTQQKVSNPWHPLRNFPG